METESSAGRSARRAKSARRYLVELALALAFVGAMLVVRTIMRNDDAGAFLRFVAVALPGSILTLWFVAIFRSIRAMDELEQAMETRSLAIACGVTIWVTTIWGISNVVFQAPALPLALVAPLAAVIFGVVRVIIGARYR